MREQDPTPRDQDLLNTIEQAIAHKAHKDGNNTDARSLEAFCARVASGTPQPDPAFQRELLARLMRELPEPASDTPPVYAQKQDGLNERKSQKQAVATKTGGAGRLVKAARAPMSIWPTQRRGRLASLALGMVGVLLMVAILAGLASMLKLRKDQARAGQVPVPTSETMTGTIQMVRDFKLMHTIDDINQEIMHQVWSPDSRTLAIVHYRSVLLFDRDTRQIRHRIKVSYGDYILTVKWSPNGSLLAISNASGMNTVGLYDPVTGEKRLSLVGLQDGTRRTIGLDAITWSPDSRMVAFASVKAYESFSLEPLGDVRTTPTVTTAAPSEISVWDATTGKRLHSTSIPVEKDDPGYDYIGSVYGITWSPDGRIIVASMGKKLRLWDATTGEQITMQPEVKSYPIPFLDWSPDGQILAVSGERAVDLWSATGKLLYTLPPSLQPLPTPPPTFMRTFIVTPLPMATSTPTPPATPDPNVYKKLRGLQWSPDGRFLVTADGTYIRLWNPAAGQLERAMADASSLFLWSPDGSVVSTIEGGDLKFWNTATGELVRFIEVPDRSRASYSAWANAAWSPDGRVVTVPAVNMTEGTRMQLWGVEAALTPSP